jgi:hypothetical protein
MRHSDPRRGRTPVILALALALAGSTGCSTPFEPLYTPTDLVGNTAASITVVANAPALVVGQSTKVAATVKDATGRVLADAAVSWSVSNSTIASVSTDGTVSALSAGTTTIVGASGTAKGETSITVEAATPGTPPVTDPPVTTPPPSGTPSPVTLPQTFDTGMPAAPAAGGKIISVGATDDLQAKIDAANPGDVIELPSGAVFTGNYILRAKPGNSDSWIVIRPAPTSVLPAEERRMTPALAAAANLPRLQTANSEPVFQTEAGAHHYRLVGLEITSVSTSGLTYALVTLGTDAFYQKTLTVVPHDLVLDRLYLHGTATLTLRRGVALNSAFSAVVDSYISDVHENGADSQAIMGWNGPGPFKILNNYLEAAGEVIMFGGGDPAIAALSPSNIEVRHNHLTRPVSWKGKWTIKNLFELKNASRVLVEGNVMENNWIAAQDGSAIVLKSTNQENTAPWSSTNHVTFRLNIVRNTGAAFVVAAHPEVYPVVPLHSVVITDNIITNISVDPFNGPQRVFLTQNSITDVSITHNTVWNETQAFGTLVMGPTDATTVRFTFSNNIAASGTNWGFYGDATAQGTPTMAKYAPDGILEGNVFAGSGVGGAYPASNSIVPLTSGVGFANPAAGDFSLLITSPFKGKATDGRDPGANVAEVLKATNGVVQ